MKNKDIMYKFIKIIEDNTLLTKFIMNVFDYNNLHDYNYMFRLIDSKEQIIIDIYDNVSDEKFNRYIFDFLESDYDVIDYKDGVVFVKKMCVLNINDCDNRILKLAYLFTLKKSSLVDYASSFLDSDFVKIIKDIIK